MTDSPDTKEVGPDKIPETLPVLPLFDTALFPKMVLPLVVMEGQSVRLVDEAMGKDRIIGILVSQSQGKPSMFPHDDLYKVGTSARILSEPLTEIGGPRSRGLAEHPHATPACVSQHVRGPRVFSPNEVCVSPLHLRTWQVGHHPIDVAQSPT